jgi:hypothetical protein
VLCDRVAAIDVRKDMVKVAVRVPGKKRGTRTTDAVADLDATIAPLVARAQ